MIYNYMYTPCTLSKSPVGTQKLFCYKYIFIYYKALPKIMWYIPYTLYMYDNSH